MSRLPLTPHPKRYRMSRVKSCAKSMSEVRILGNNPYPVDALGGGKRKCARHADVLRENRLEELVLIFSVERRLRNRMSETFCEI